MSKVLTWKIFYDDRKPFTSSDGKPEEAPLDGVQVITQEWDNGVIERLHSNDYYYWINNKQWIDGNHLSLLTWIRKALPNLKYGRFTDSEVFRAIKKVAFHE